MMKIHCKFPLNKNPFVLQNTSTIASKRSMNRFNEFLVFPKVLKSLSAHAAKSNLSKCSFQYIFGYLRLTYVKLINATRSNKVSND